MSDSLDLVAFLADPNTFDIRHDWEDSTELDETANEYYEISRAGESWTREEFIEQVRRAPLEEKLQIHEELNSASSKHERLTKDDIDILEQVYNASGVSKKQFTKAIIGLAHHDAVELVVKAEATIDGLVDLITLRYESGFPSCAALGRQNALHILSHFRKITGCSSVVDAFVTAASSELADVWVMDALGKAFNRKLRDIKSKAKSAERNLVDEHRIIRSKSPATNETSDRLHDVRSGSIEKSKRKHKRQHLRHKLRKERAVSQHPTTPPRSPSTEDLITGEMPSPDLDTQCLASKDLTGLSQSNATHLLSPRSSPDHRSQDSNQLSPGESPEEAHPPSSGEITWFTSRSYSDARAAFGKAMTNASKLMDGMADLSFELDQACNRLRPSPTASLGASDEASPSTKRKAEPSESEQGSRKKQRTAKTNAEIKIKANQETISKYFEENKTSPQKTSTTKSPKPSSRVPAGTSCIDFPPLSAKTFGLIQEQTADKPFELLVAVCLLNKTKGTNALPVFLDLMEKYPTPEALVKAGPDPILKLITPLGLQHNRTKTIVELAQRWVDDPPVKGRRFRTLNYPTFSNGKNIGTTEVLEDGDPRRGAFEIGGFPGVGRYALDSWRIFCRDVLRGLATGYNGEGASEGFEPEWKRVVPTDKELRAYLKWMWLREGWNWEPLEGKKSPATPEYLEQVGQGEHEFGKTGIIGIEENMDEIESSQETLCGW